MTSDKFDLDDPKLDSWFNAHPGVAYVTRVIVDGRKMMVFSDQPPGSEDAPAIVAPTLVMSQELIKQIKTVLLGKNNGVRSEQQAYSKIGGKIGWSALNVSHVTMYGLTNLTSSEYAALQAMLEEETKPKPAQPEVSTNGATEHEPDG